MISQILRAASHNVKTNVAHFRKLNSIGLNPVYIKYLKVVKNSKIATHHLQGRKIFYINSHDLLHSLKEIFYEEVYKIELGATPKIIDCGANIGLSAIYFLKHHPGARIIAFEPDNTNYDLLLRNLKSFGISGSVEARKEAVWDNNEELSFKSVESLGSMISNEGGPDTYKVKAVRLKELLTEKTDLLKMDIEGAEYNVLRDIAPELGLVDNLFIEYHGTFSEQGKLLELLEIVKKSGFYFYIKEAWDIFHTPFSRPRNQHSYDVQLNIFCFRKI